MLKESKSAFLGQNRLDNNTSPSWIDKRPPAYPSFSDLQKWMLGVVNPGLQLQPPPMTNFGLAGQPWPLKPNMCHFTSTFFLPISFDLSFRAYCSCNNLQYSKVGWTQQWNCKKTFWFAFRRPAPLPMTCTCWNVCTLNKSDQSDEKQEDQVGVRDRYSTDHS